MPVLIFFLIFSLDLTAAFAQVEKVADDSTGKNANEQLNQKIKMVNYILASPAMMQRLENSDDQLAKDLVARASENFLEMEEYFDQGQFLEAEAIIDFVLRDLSASSQLLNASSRKKQKYQTSLDQLDSFVLPAWVNLSSEDNALLNKKLKEVNELRSEAIELSQSSNYDQAVERVTKAFQIKVTLIDKLQHENTVTYDLKFDTVDDEYRYLNNRTYHYLELVEFALSKKEIDLQTRQLVDNYIYQSVVNLEAAESFQSDGKFPKAISVLDQSIEQLTTVLKILGIKI